ncbi:protein kinase [Colletotrichum camelliae]|nr:protein kinase [Colletotrichum camelliae]
MHDLESFFWVLFWICIHYGPNGKDIGTTAFEHWNYDDDDKLAVSKQGVVADEVDFLGTTRRHFTAHYQPLIPLVNWLRRVVFPNGKRRRQPDLNLYCRMVQILRSLEDNLEISEE